MDLTFAALIRNDAFCAGISLLVGILFGAAVTYFVMRPKRDSLGRFTKQ